MSKKIKKELSKVGGKLSPKELAKIKGKLGISSGVKSVAKNLGIKIGGGGGGGGRSSAGTPGFSYSSSQGFTPAEFDYKSALNLVNAQGNIDSQIAGINSEAAKYVASLQVKGSKDVANIQAGATRYVADRELEGALGTENIRAKGAVDLQKIVNTGMKDVENIRGGYGIQGKKIDRSTAILDGLVSAFNF
jgi:hypothetical protein